MSLQLFSKHLAVLQGQEMRCKIIGCLEFIRNDKEGAGLFGCIAKSRHDDTACPDPASHEKACCEKRNACNDGIPSLPLSEANGPIEQGFSAQVT